jgi:hypothetical protein
MPLPSPVDDPCPHNQLGHLQNPPDHLVIFGSVTDELLGALVGHSEEGADVSHGDALLGEFAGYLAAFAAGGVEVMAGRLGKLLGRSQFGGKVRG